MSSSTSHRKMSESEDDTDASSTLVRNRLRAEARRRMNSSVSARQLRASVDSIIGSMRDRRGQAQGRQSPDSRASQASPELLLPRVAAADGRHHSLDSARDSFVAESNHGPGGFYPDMLVSTPHPSPLPWAGETPGSQADSRDDPIFEENEKTLRHSIDIGHYQRTIRRQNSHHHRQSKRSLWDLPR